MAAEPNIEWGAGLKPGELKQFVEKCGKHRKKFASSDQPSNYKVRVELAGYQESIFDQPQPVLKLTNPKTAVNTLCLLSEAEAVGIRKSWVEYHLIWTDEQRKAYIDKMEREFEERQAKLDAEYEVKRLREWKENGHYHDCSVALLCHARFRPENACHENCAAGPDEPLKPRPCAWHQANGYQLDLLKIERHV